MEGEVKKILASLVEDENEEVALNASGALATIIRRAPGDGIGAFGERRVSMMELGRGDGPLAKCGAIVLDSMPWLVDGDEV